MCDQDGWALGTKYIHSLGAMPFRAQLWKQAEGRANILSLRGHNELTVLQSKHEQARLAAFMPNAKPGFAKQPSLYPSYDGSRACLPHLTRFHPPGF